MCLLPTSWPTVWVVLDFLRPMHSIALSPGPGQSPVEMGLIGPPLYVYHCP